MRDVSRRGFQGGFESIHGKLWESGEGDRAPVEYDIGISDEVGMPPGQNDAEEFFQQSGREVRIGRQRIQVALRRDMQAKHHLSRLRETHLR